METTTQIRVRVPARRMKKVQALFDQMGTDTTGAINMFFAQVERSGGLPFDVVAREIPNAATRAAMREAEANDLPTYATTNELMKALKKK